MTPILKVFSVVFVGMLALLLVVQPASAHHAWENYHWSRTTPTFKLQVKNHMSTQWQKTLKVAVADWNKSTVVDFVLQAQTKPKTCAGVNGMVEVCNGAYGENGWLGLAEIYVVGDTITMATVKLNDTYYNTPAFNTPAWRKQVMCQEMGHTLGVGHNDEDFNTTTGTCMDYSYNPVPNQHPDAHDYELLTQIYAHLDSYNSYVKAGTQVAGSAFASNEDSGQRVERNKTKEWGKVIKRDKKNHPSLFARKEATGEMVFTHVVWIPDAEGADEEADHEHAE